MDSTRCIHSITVLSVLALATAAFAQSPQTIDIEAIIHKSNSGRFSLSVTPKKSSLFGPADYEMRCDGKLIWTADLPVTLREPLISEKGAVIGVAYYGGVQAIPPILHVCILGSTGKVLLHETIERRKQKPFQRHSRVQEFPYVNKLVLNEVSDQAILSVQGVWSMRDMLWIYDLAEGVKIREFRLPVEIPRTQTPIKIELMCPILETPLTLVQWSCGKDESALTLIGPKGKVAWSLLLPYRCPEIIRSKDMCYKELETATNRLEAACAGAGTFTLTHTDTLKSVNCAVRQDDLGRWHVTCGQ